MPSRDAYGSGHNLLYGLNLDAFPEGSSATMRRGRAITHSEIRAAVEQARPKMNLREWAVFHCRFELPEPLTQMQIAEMLHINQASVSRTEHKVLRLIQSLLCIFRV